MDEPNTTTPSPTPEHQRGPIRLGEQLLHRGVITQEQLDHALAYQQANKPDALLGHVLVELGLVTQEDLATTLAAAVGVPFARLATEFIQPEAVTVLPFSFLEKHNLMPITLVDECLTIAVEDFTDVFLIEEIAQLCGYTVSPVAATPENIAQVREAFKPDEEQGQRFNELLSDMPDSELTIVESHQDEPPDLELAASDSPVITLVNRIITAAARARASDIHIEPDDGICPVRYRVDGVLHETAHIPLRTVPAVVSRIKVMAAMDIAERRLPQDGHITVMLDNRPIELRVSTMPTRFGEKLVMRVIDEQAAIFDINKLGMPHNMLAALRNTIRLPNGIVLVTGPTGSGKSTTLYASLLDIADRKKNICTLEDPVEHNLKGINQFQINPKVHFTFPRALRSLVRQDPDVIMVGEIRDADTAKLAAESALTGHLVLSTLHTNDAPSAVTRLVNMGLEPYLVAASLRCVLAQRLVRRICPRCAVPTDLPAASRAILKPLLDDQPLPEPVYTGKGCNHCRGTGFSGRAGIFELLALNDDLLDAVAHGAPLRQIHQLAQTANYLPLIHHGLELVRAGQVDLTALLEVTGRVATHTPNAT